MRLEQPALARAAPEAELFKKILTETAFDGHVAEVGSQGGPRRSVMAELRHGVRARGWQAVLPCHAAHPDV